MRARDKKGKIYFQVKISSYAIDVLIPTFLPTSPIIWRLILHVCGHFFYSTKPPDDDNRTDNVHIAEFVNVTSNPVNWTEMPTKFPGQFASHRYCLAGVTQRHMYYIFLVSIILIFIMVSLVPSFSVLATCRKIPLKTLYDFTLGQGYNINDNDNI